MFERIELHIFFVDVDRCWNDIAIGAVVVGVAHRLAVGKVGRVREPVPGFLRQSCL